MVSKPGWAGLRVPYAAFMDAQSKQRGAQNEPALKAAACASATSAGGYLNGAEPNITGGAAADPEMASQLLNFLASMKNSLTQLARKLGCPS